MRIRRDSFAIALLLVPPPSRGGAATAGAAARGPWTRRWSAAAAGSPPVWTSRSGPARPMVDQSEMVQKLSLTDDQRKKMDDILQQSIV
jgi:Spy/CpxP family protein refolding chaperone